MYLIPFAIRLTPEKYVPLLLVKTDAYGLPRLGIFSKQPKDSDWQNWTHPIMTTGIHRIIYSRRRSLGRQLEGVFRLHTGTMSRVGTTEGPISVLCESAGAVYALGPGGMWLCKNNTAAKQSYPIARSVRAAIADHKVAYG